MNAFTLELRRSRSIVLWTGITLLLYAAILGLMYPVLRDNDDLMRQYMETFPKQFLAVFGMTGLLSDHGVFFTTYFASWLWPIAATAAGTILGTRATAADLDRGFLDLALATPLSRARYLATNVAGQVAAMAALAAATLAGLLATGALVGAGFDVGRFLVAGLLAFAFGCAVAGATTLLAVATLSRGRAAGIVGAVVAAMYVVFVVTQLSTDWAFLAPLSAWDHFGTTAVIDQGTIPVGDLALFGGVGAGCWAAAIALFRRRDLAA